MERERSLPCSQEPITKLNPVHTTSLQSPPYSCKVHISSILLSMPRSQFFLFPLNDFMMQSPPWEANSYLACLEFCLEISKRIIWCSQQPASDPIQEYKIVVHTLTLFSQWFSSVGPGPKFCSRKLSEMLRSESHNIKWVMAIKFSIFPNNFFIICH